MSRVPALPRSVRGSPGLRGDTEEEVFPGASTRLDLSGTLLPAYPADVWKRSLEITARHVYPELDTASAFHQLGRRVVEGVGETVLGRAMVGMGRLLGQPRYYQGILEACAEVAGGRNVRVTQVSTEGTGATYRVEWDG